MGERIRCRKCGDILHSKYRHDFQMCKCGSCYIDGGNDYFRTPSFYDTEKKAEYGDKLICLSTCEYSQTNGRLVVVARKIK